MNAGWTTVYVSDNLNGGKAYILMCMQIHPAYLYKRVSLARDSRRLVYVPLGLRNYLSGLAVVLYNRGYLYEKYLHRSWLNKMCLDGTGDSFSTK